MRKLLFFIFAGLTVFSNSIHAQNDYIPPPKIWAVIIGVADYRDSKVADLKFAESDAKAYYDFLKSPAGGAVPEENIALLTSTKATRSNILKAITETYMRASNQDLVVFYFSGHGMSGEYDNNGYLLGWDSEPDNLAGTAVEMEDIKKWVDRSKAKIKLNFVDACHAGYFQTTNTKGDMTEANRQISEALLSGIAKSDAGNISFLASSAKEQSLEDDKLKSGVFTYYLLKGLSGAADLSQPNTKGFKDGIVSLAELNTYLIDAVRKQTAYKQNPTMAGTDFDKEFPLAVLKVTDKLTDIMADRNKVTTPAATTTKNNSTSTTTPNVSKTSMSDLGVAQKVGSNTVYTKDAKNYDPQASAYGASEARTEKYDPQAKAYGGIEIAMKNAACKDINHCYGHYCFINRTKTPLIIYEISGQFGFYNIPIKLAVDEKVCTQKLTVSRVRDGACIDGSDLDYTFKMQTLPDNEDEPIKYTIFTLNIEACKEKTIELSNKNVVYRTTKY